MVIGAVIFLALNVVVLGLPTQEAAALPEYSAQVGEPCATCHISPSGGGARSPRGQAWVGSGKPGAVPDLVQALEVLGVRLEMDPNDFIASPGAAASAQPLQPAPVQPAEVHLWLRDYDGN
jgi:mono/diheme cytochrome c family protein